MNQGLGNQSACYTSQEDKQLIREIVDAFEEDIEKIVTTSTNFNDIMSSLTISQEKNSVIKSLGFNSLL